MVNDCEEGQFCITGASLSVIITFIVQELELPEASVAVQITVVVPTGKVAPARLCELLHELKLCVSTGLKQLSVAVGLNSVPETT